MKTSAPLVKQRKRLCQADVPGGLIGAVGLRFLLRELEGGVDRGRLPQRDPLFVEMLRARPDDCPGGAGCAVTIDPIAIRTKNPRPTLPPDDGRLSRPLFTLREAARYLGMPVSTLHVWGRSTDPLITVGPRRDQQATVPFIGFAEAFVLSAFRRAGVPLQRIRPAVELLRETMGIEHALAAKNL